MISYRKNYLKIYMWQAISIILGFASLFVVIPYLSSNKTLYGIYSVCTSLTIFFSYADLGFLSSGAKFAAEYYIKGDRENEMRVVGFTAFIMITVFLLLDIVIVFLGIYPHFLIPDLQVGSENYIVARKLLLTLAMGCPAIIGQRILGIIYTIRVEDYKYQRFQILGSLSRILSVLYFFTGGRYMIVEYYVFFQFVYFVVVVSALLYAKRYGYKIKELIRSFRFDKKIFNREKALSGASLVGIGAMVLYNELDQVAISNIFGIDAVAVYAAAFSIMTLVRTFNSLVYAPYTSRYNHYAGLKDFEGLTKFVNSLIILSSPILLIPIVNFALYTEPFVICWVGENYIDSALLMSFLVLSYALNFLSVPLSNYMIATEQNRNIAKTSMILPVIYWIGIVLLGKFVQVEAFAIMKFVAPTIVCLFYWYICKKDIESRGYAFISPLKLSRYLICPLIVAVLLAECFKPYMLYIHNKSALAINLCFMFLSVAISLFSALITNKELRELATSFIPKKNKK